MNVLDEAHDTTYLRALSPDETQLAEASVGGGVRITRFPTGEVIQQIGAPEMAHAYDVLALAWSPNGKYLATGGLDGLVKVWELAMGACIQAYRGHTMPVLDIAWNTMGTLLASGGGDEMVQVWNPITGETCYTYRVHRATINRIAWEFGGEVLVTTDSGITTLYWDVDSGRAVDVSARRYRFESHPWTRSAFVGSRWALRTEVDRYDFFLAPAGMTGGGEVGGSWRHRSDDSAEDG